VRFGGALLAALVLTLGVDRRGRTPSAPPRPTLFAGCGAVLRGGICEVPKDATIRVFAPRDARFVVDGQLVAATLVRAFPHGGLHRVVLPPRAKLLTVNDARLRLAPQATYAWLTEARALRGKDPAAARARAEPALSSPDPAERALALGLVARVELSRGQVDAAIAKFREALSLPSPRVSDRAEDAFALAFALNQRSRRYGEARAVLDEIEPSLQEYPEGRARLPFYRAEVALESGDIRFALRALGDALRRASELGLTRLERNTRALIAAVHQFEGHFDDGIAALEELDRELTADPVTDGCDHASALSNLGFALERRARARLDLGEARGDDDITAPAARMLALFPARCADPHHRGIALYLSAAAALERGRYADAKRMLGEGRATLPKPRTNDVLQWLELEARIAFAERRFKDAIAKYDEMVSTAEAAHQTDILWRAVVGRAEALEGDAQLDAALAAYRRAESLLDDQTLALPLGDGRGVFLSRSERSARLLIDLLLRSGQPAEAFAVARRARARLLTATARATSLESLGPEARARWDAAVASFRKTRGELDEAAEGDWKLAASALKDAELARAEKISAMLVALDDAMASLAIPRSAAPLGGPAPGEVWLGFHRARAGYVAFVATHERVTSFAFEVTTSLPALADRLLPRLELANAKRLVVLPYGPLRDVDLHALPVELPVEYALDVPRTRAPVDAADSVAIVVDPTNDLAATRDEARAIEALFAARSGFAVRTLIGSDATARMVSQLLESSGTFHYAGHGVFAGPEGIEARLPLSSGSALGILDVLTRTRVPRRVVLSACDTGRAPSARTETIGLAHAFILAGSEFVIAPTRKVDDALAAKLAVVLYRELLAGVEPSEALRRAQKEARNGDWAAWRLLRH